MWSADHSLRNAALDVSNIFGNMFLQIVTMHCQETDSIRSENKNKCVAVGTKLTGEYIVVTGSAIDTSDTAGYQGRI